MTKQRLEYLLECYLKDSLTTAEQKEWHAVLNNIELKSWLDELIDNHYYQLTEEELAGMSVQKADEIFAGIVKQKPWIRKGKIGVLWRRLAVAASVLIILSVAVYFKLNRPQLATLAQNRNVDIQPGSNGAILTLASGKRISLGRLETGTVTTQSGSEFHKVGDSLLIYQASQSVTTKTSLNTLETPKGHQYSVILPDGTKVWLNAASSITYPTSFIGKNRVVSMTGEGYFEVIHRATQPFQVKVNGRTIEDIGTHFNINAYEDEPDFRTTLTEGSVSISNAAQKVILKPGEQAIISPGKASITVKTADLETAMAWKNGLFKFTNTPIDAVMRQLSRWYNVDVEYPSGVPKTTFTGEMQRDVNASQVLVILSYFKIHFRIENGTDKKTIVMLP